MYQGAINIEAAEAEELAALREPRWAELVARFNAERDTRAAPAGRLPTAGEGRGRFASLEHGKGGGQAPSTSLHSSDTPTDQA